VGIGLTINIRDFQKVYSRAEKKNGGLSHEKKKGRKESTGEDEKLARRQRRHAEEGRQA